MFPILAFSYCKESLFFHVSSIFNNKKPAVFPIRFTDIKEDFIRGKSIGLSGFSQSSKRGNSRTPHSCHVPGPPSLTTPRQWSSVLRRSNKHGWQVYLGSILVVYNKNALDCGLGHWIIHVFVVDGRSSTPHASIQKLRRLVRCVILWLRPASLALWRGSGGKCHHRMKFVISGEVIMNGSF